MLLYADDLVVIAETEDDLIKRLSEWKDNMENRGTLRVNMNKTKVMISGECRKQQQASAGPCASHLHRFPETAYSPFCMNTQSSLTSELHFASSFNVSSSSQSCSIVSTHVT